MPSCDSPDALTLPRRRRLRAWMICALLLFPCAPLHPQEQPKQEEEEDLTAGLADLEIHLKNGQNLFNELKFSEAIAELSRVVSVYEEGKLQDFGPRQVQMVARALDLRARAYFNQGEKERAKEDFDRLLHVKIDYEIDRNLVSPKVVDLYEQVRKETLGALTITTDPPGAEASLNDEPLPRTPVVGRPAIKGTYKLKLVLKGFQDYEEEVSVAARTETKKEIRLVPNRRNLQFLTQPPGVNVLVDGEAAGTTFGALSPDLHAMARDAGLDPSQTSAPLLVRSIKQGVHEVRFEKECYQASVRTVTVALDVERNSPQVFQPVLLKEDHGELRITSHPSGAEVLVDGVSQGTTPVLLPAICAGERDIRLIKKGGGTWFDSVRVKSGAQNILDAFLRPTLLYLGTFRLDEWGRLTWSDEDKAFLEDLTRLRSVNQVRPGDTLKAFRDALVEEMTKPEVAEQLKQGAGLPPARVLEAFGKFQTDLVLAILSLQDQPDRGAPTVFLYSSEQPEPDVARLDLASGEARKAFLSRFDGAPELSRPWIGATFADTLLTEAPVTIRVLKGGPAASAGLVSGDLVVSLNGHAVANAQSLSVASARWKEKDKITLGIRRAGVARSLSLAVGRTPILIPMNSPDRLYNKALCDYRQLSRGADDPLDRALALLNLGIGFMHFKSYDKALSEALSLANLPPGAGISRGTVRYYQGLCYLKKDLVPEARTAFQDAASSAEATLESNDGSPVSIRARKLLQ